jgi:dipeptidyl aminopeptidase/acylaminoacyl peptidase
MKLFRRIVGTLVIVAIVFYLAGLGVLYFFQRNFQYDPTGSFLALSSTALTNASVVTIPTSGGESVKGWYAPPAAGKPVIVYYKGNADSFSSEHIRFEQFAADGYGFVAFDYRGFPASPGVIV